MTTPLTSLAPYVLQYVSNCPNVLAQFHIRQAAIEFLRRTLAWRVTLPPVLATQVAIAFTAPLVAATGGTLTVAFAGTTRNDYVITFSDGSTQVVTLTNGSAAVAWVSPVTATINATYSQVVYAFPATTDASISKLLRYSLNGRDAKVVSPDVGENQYLWNTLSADCAWTTDRVNFNIYPAPYNATDTYAMTVALQPTQLATTIPDFVFDGHAEEIAAGALARIYSIPKKDWSDLREAAGKRAYFDDRIGIVAERAATGYSRGRQRVRGFNY